MFLVDLVLCDEHLYDKHVPSRLAITTFTFHEGEVDNENDPRSYSPHSDFSLNTGYVPIVINETISPRDETDRCPMLLQADGMRSDTRVSICHVKSSQLN